MEPSPKITVTAKADAALDEMILKINTDFKSGRVQKFQLASWIILNFEKSLSAKVIKQIQNEHFDKLAHLRSVTLEVIEAQKSGKEIKLDELLSPLMAKAASKPVKQTKADPDEN